MQGSKEYLAVLRDGAEPYVAQVRYGFLTAQQALDLMRDNQEHLAVVRTLKRILVRILPTEPRKDCLFLAGYILETSFQSH